MNNDRRRRHDLFLYVPCRCPKNLLVSRSVFFDREARNKNNLRGSVRRYIGLRILSTKDHSHCLLPLLIVPRRRLISPFAVGRSGCRQREIATTQMHSSDERRKREDTERERERAATAALQVLEPASEQAPDRACERRTKASATDGGGAVLGFEVN